MRRAVRIDERHATSLRTRVRAQDVWQHHADVVGVDVERAGGAPCGGTPARLEHRPLRGHLHRRTGAAPRGQRGHEFGPPLGVERTLVQRLEIRLEAAVLVAETVLLPTARSERLVREHHGPLDGQPLGGPSEEVLGHDRERRVRGGDDGRRLHLHANLRGHEFLDLDVPRPDLDSRAPGSDDLNGPHAAHLVVRHGEGFPRHGAELVRELRVPREHLSIRINELHRHGKRPRRVAVRTAEKRMHEDFLVVAVDAAVGPHVRLTSAFRHVRTARALRNRLVEGLGEREERRVAAVLPRGDHRERVGVLLHVAGAPAVGVRDALAHENVVGAVDRHEQSGDRRTPRKRRRPHVHASLHLAYGEADVRQAHEAVDRVGGRIVGTVARRNEIHAVRGDAVLVADVQRRGDLLVQPFGQAELLDHGLAGDVPRLLRVPSAAVVTAVTVLFARKQLHDVRARHGTDRAREVRHVHGVDGDCTPTSRRQIAAAGGERDGRRPVARGERAAERLLRHPSVRQRQPRLGGHAVCRARLEIRLQNHGLAPPIVVDCHGARIRDDLHVLHEGRQIRRVRHLHLNAAQPVHVDAANFRFLRLLGLLLHWHRLRLGGFRGNRNRTSREGRTCHGRHDLRRHVPCRLRSGFSFRPVTTKKRHNDRRTRQKREYCCFWIVH